MIIRNEEAQKKYKELLVEYLKEKIEQRFTMRRRENAQILGSEIMEHSKNMSDRSKFYLERQIALESKGLGEISCKINEEIKDYTKRPSSLASDFSSNSTENSNKGGYLERKIITDRLFESRLLGNEIELFDEINK